MDAHDDITFAHSKDRGDLRIMHRHDLLHFEIVIPGTKRPHFILLALLRMV